MLYRIKFQVFSHYKRTLISRVPSPAFALVAHGIAMLCMAKFLSNMANLRDLIAANGLVISNWIQIVNFSTRVTVQFDGWPRKTIGHLFYATSSFVHHFIAIGELKLELHPGTAQSGWNSTIFRAARPWNLTDDLEKNRATLLCYFKPCAAFRTHWWIQTGVTVRKRPIWVKFNDF